MIKVVDCILVVGFVMMPIFSCSGTRPNNLGVKDSRLVPCPSTPNCVSSDDPDGVHFIAAIHLSVPASDAWRRLRSAIESYPRTEIVRATDDYIHAECRSAIFGFVDDVEFHLRPSQGIIAVRSASRLGYSDFGVNRKRIETLRVRLTELGVTR